MPPHTPKPGAGDTGPRERCIADGGYGFPLTPLEFHRQGAGRSRAGNAPTCAVRDKPLLQKRLQNYWLRSEL
jgi:hypothetical protein